MMELITTTITTPAVHYHNKGSTACKANSVRADHAEEKVLAWLHEFLINPFWIRRVTEAIKQRYEVNTKPLEDERKKQEQGVADIVQQQKDLLRHYEKIY